MELAAVQARDIYALVEITLTEVKMIEMILGNIEYAYKGDDLEQAKAAEYLTDSLFPKIQSIRKSMEERNNA